MMSEFTVHICAFREAHLDGINYSDGIHFFLSAVLLILILHVLIGFDPVCSTYVNETSSSASVMMTVANIQRLLEIKSSPKGT